MIPNTLYDVPALCVFPSIWDTYNVLAQNLNGVAPAPEDSVNQGGYSVWDPKILDAVYTLIHTAVLTWKFISAVMTEWLKTWWRCYRPWQARTSAPPLFTHNFCHFFRSDRTNFCKSFLNRETLLYVGPPDFLCALTFCHILSFRPSQPL